MVSASTISSILLLFAGITVVVFAINRQDHKAKESSRVATPMISMSSKHKRGPWPKCVGMDGQACCNLIAGDYDCIVIPDNSMVTMDYQLTRVRVFVDEQNVVTKMPRLG